MDENYKVPFVNTAKIMFLIQGGEGPNPLMSVPIDELKQYVHVRINNIVKTYDSNGEMTLENNYYPLHRCSVEEFKSEFEKEVFMYHSD